MDESYSTADLVKTRDRALEVISKASDFLSLYSRLSRHANRGEICGTVKALPFRCAGDPATIDLDEAYQRLASFSGRPDGTPSRQVLDAIEAASPGRSEPFNICAGKWTVFGATAHEVVFDLMDELSALGRRVQIDRDRNGYGARRLFRRDVPVGFEPAELAVRIRMESRNAVAASRPSKWTSEQQAERDIDASTQPGAEDGPTVVGSWRYEGNEYPCNGNQLTQTNWELAATLYKASNRSLKLDTLAELTDDGLLEWATAEKRAQRANAWFKEQGIKLRIKLDKPWFSLIEC